MSPEEATGLASVLARIEAAAKKCGRDPSGIQLLPVAKGQTVEALLAALRDPKFPRRFGENYWEELERKRAGLADQKNIEWHFIGRLQSRKIQEVCAATDVIHTVARDKEILEIARSRRAAEVKYFIQVNVSGEEQKNGCGPAELVKLLATAEKAGVLANVAGLMTLPAPLSQIGESALREDFGKLRELRDRHLPGRSLSMGMSEDFEIAIEEGADWVRIGTALFGERRRGRQ